jgi:hypothetical protein
MSKPLFKECTGFIYPIDANEFFPLYMLILIISIYLNILLIVFSFTQLTNLSEKEHRKGS